MSHEKENRPLNERIRLIPIDEIKILNPRQRPPKEFQKIVDSIRRLGLKKPITVFKPENAPGGKKYYLICGQGRLEAYMILGEKTVPAIVKTDVTVEECILMSVAENYCRRKPGTIESFDQIAELSKRGYSNTEIARKIDMPADRIRTILFLLKNGEERLLSAVKQKQISFTMATEIASATDKNAQEALLEAYTSKKLRGPALIRVKRLIEKRERQGKALFEGIGNRLDRQLSADVLVRTYKREAARKKEWLDKAKRCEARLMFIISAIKQLLEDKDFVALLEAENLSSIPKNLMDKLYPDTGAANG